MNRTLDEFVARLRSDIRYFVKLDNHTSFEQAVSKAQMVEQLLSEATADRLIHPGSHTEETTSVALFKIAANGSNLGMGHLEGATVSTVAESDTSPRNALRRLHAPALLPEITVEHEDSLREAHQRIAELSLTVDRTRAQLENSNARLAALARRNDELAQSVFCNNPSPSATSVLPDVRYLFLCSLVISCLASVSAIADIGAASAVADFPVDNISRLSCPPHPSVPHRYHCRVTPSSYQEPRLVLGW
ncbi:unnamed protein product [Nippostrongylus brasiliensis]|uniref:Uncharacterized protein n=1 Tax=Nippostrongylus brasiliensis TaxID=27835 RepID=A0A0N4YQU6_NIPBR|nr:unnamed protein product [Nippostrongylus brasiliensis]